mgnify:FL=1
MNFVKSIALAVLMLALAVCALPVAEAGPDWDGGRLRAEGTGIAPPNAINNAQARALARRAAITDAYRQLAEQIQGVQVDASTTVENMMVTNNTVRTHVSALIRGARVVDEIYRRDGSCTVTVEIPVYGVGSLAGAVFTPNATREPWADPNSIYGSYTPRIYDTTGSGTYDRSSRGDDWGRTTPAAPAYPSPATSSAATAPYGRAVGGYTGLIVDCSGMGLRPVMSPVIKAQSGYPIYGYKNLDSDKVVANGMAAYVRRASDATRAGRNPLCIRAIGLDAGANPILSNEDARRVLIENGASGFLDATNVVFIR